MSSCMKLKKLPCSIVPVSCQIHVLPFNVTDGDIFTWYAGWIHIPYNPFLLCVAIRNLGPKWLAQTVIIWPSCYCANHSELYIYTAKIVLLWNCISDISCLRYIGCYLCQLMRNLTQLLHRCAARWPPGCWRSCCCWNNQRC